VQEGGKIDYVQQSISNTAGQALEFLKAREEFWNQLQLGCVPVSALKHDSKSTKSQHKFSI
jgi:hypothetical protein